MIRFFNAYFPARTLFLGISEAFLVTFAFVAASIARLGTDSATLMLNYEWGFLKIIVVVILFITCMYYFDLYDSLILSNRREVLTRMIQVLGTVCILLALLYYVYPALQLGRGIFVIGFLFVAVLLIAWRRLFLMINSLPQFAERALVFGDGPLAELLVNEWESRPELGVRVVARAGEGSNGNGSQIAPHGASASDDLNEIVEGRRINRIIIAMKDRRGKLPVEQLLAMKSRGVVIQDGTEVYETITGKVPIESLHLGWLLFSPGFRASRALLIYKRLVSILVSAIGLLLCLPLIPLIALVIRLTSPGRIFYRQQRVGRDGSVFDCYKFRTMRVDAEANTGPMWAGASDPRITSVGKFLRRGRLDEIPQLWNVFKGDMSLIGPRPERPEFVQWLNHDVPYYHLRHTIRPGLTGWAQIRYKYGNSVEDVKEKLRYDLFYIKNMSPGLDFLVLFHTVKIILLGRGAQ